MATECCHLSNPYFWTHSSFLACGFHVPVSSVVKCLQLGRGIGLFFHDRDTRRWGVVSSTPRLHFTHRKDPVPIVQEAGWAPGPVWTGRKSCPHQDLIPDHPACSQSLYWLSYPAHKLVSVLLHITFHEMLLLENVLRDRLWRGKVSLVTVFRTALRPSLPPTQWVHLVKLLCYEAASLYPVCLHDEHSDRFCSRGFRYYIFGK